MKKPTIYAPTQDWHPYLAYASSEKEARLIANMVSIEHAVRQCHREGYAGIYMECFNKEEADELAEICATQFPDIPIQFSWLDFSEGKPK